MRRRAALSILDKAGSKEAADKAVDEVWKSCWNDTRPFDDVCIPTYFRSIDTIMHLFRQMNGKMAILNRQLVCFLDGLLRKRLNQQILLLRFLMLIDYSPRMLSDTKRTSFGSTFNCSIMVR